MIETVAELHITSDMITSEEILQSLQIVPDQAYNIGSYIKFANGELKKIPEKKNGIIIKSKIDKKDTLEVHIENILTQIKFAKENFTLISDKIDCFIKIGIYLHTDKFTYNHSFYLDKNIIKELSYMDIEISYDLYVIGK